MKLKLDIFLTREDGMTKVLFGNYDTRKEARDRYQEIRRIVRDAYVVKSYDENIVRHLSWQG
mgnify:CR=1 FL=1